MVCDWAKALGSLGGLCWLLNLTYKGDIEKHCLVCGLFIKGNLKGATIGHHSESEASLTNELAAVVGYFDLVVNEDFCLLFFVHNHVPIVSQGVGHRQSYQIFF